MGTNSKNVRDRVISKCRDVKEFNHKELRRHVKNSILYDGEGNVDRSETNFSWIRRTATSKMSNDRIGCSRTPLWTRRLGGKSTIGACFFAEESVVKIDHQAEVAKSLFEESEREHSLQLEIGDLRADLVVLENILSRHEAGEPVDGMPAAAPYVVPPVRGRDTFQVSAP